MKKRHYRNLPYEPCGLKISPEDVFTSGRNLGLSLMAALTNQSTEDIQINRCAMTIGLGCFSLLGINHCWYNDLDDLQELDVMEDWSLISSVRYDLYDDSILSKNTIAHFDLNLNIDPPGLVKGNYPNAIHLFGPKRLLQKLKLPSHQIRSFKPSHIDIDNYIEGGIEPRDCVISPSLEEFDIYWKERDETKRFRILMNIITSFASEISLRLTSNGCVQPALIHFPNDDAAENIHWLNDHKLGKTWTPTKKETFVALRGCDLKMRDINCNVRKSLKWLNADFLARVRAAKSCLAK